MSTPAFPSRLHPYYGAIAFGAALAATTFLDLPQWVDRTIWIVALVLASIM